jgi:hypothetical protein
MGGVNPKNNSMMNVPGPQGVQTTGASIQKTIKESINIQTLIIENKSDNPASVGDKKIKTGSSMVMTPTGGI